MEQRNLKINKNKGGSGSTSFRISLPASWIKAMDLDDDNQAIVRFDGKRILIEKEKEDEKASSDR